MPGISFLFKKRFHPQRIDNQKRVFVTEENKKKHLEKEKEMAAQVAKERELQMYEGLGKGPELDPRNASLKFMYHAPAALKKDSKGEKIDLLAKVAPVALDEHGDDDHVRAFRAKFFPGNNNNNSNSNCKEGEEKEDEEVLIGPALPPPPGLSAEDDSEQESDENNNDKKVEKAKAFTHYEQSTLEQAIGRKKQAVLTLEEQQERYPQLKNAPVNGTYAKTTALTTHKPFNGVIRHVRCLRCGEWGHCSGDRECVLRDHNPLDFERQLREDPMAAHRPIITDDNDHLYPAQNNSSRGGNNNNNKVSRAHSNNSNNSQKVSAVEARKYFYGDHDYSSSNNNCNSTSNGYESSDPEGDFLRTLTRREKKLLLRKLHQLQNPSTAVAAATDSSDTSDSSSSSGGSSSSSDVISSDSDSEDDKEHGKKHRKHSHQKKRKHHHRHHRDRSRKKRKHSRHGSDSDDDDNDKFDTKKKKVETHHDGTILREGSADINNETR